MHRTALFSRDRRFPYRLGRWWADGPKACFILLNPSTADEEREDAMVRRCVGFARSLGYGALEVVDLYAYVATDPAQHGMTSDGRPGRPSREGRPRQLQGA